MGTLDLNLVRVFVTVYETGGVTSAAEALHITQPTVSYGLGKLRRHFGDELFVREGRTLVPTAQAQRLYRQLSDGLGTIDGALHEGDRFDPATDATHFTLAMSDLGEATLLPRVLARMRSRAPHSSLSVRALDVAGVEQQLLRGEVDGFIATPLFASDRTTRIPLFRERYVAAVSSDHPRITGGRVTLRQLRAERHAVVTGPSGHTGPSLALAEHGLTDQVVLEGTRFGTLPYVLEATDLVAILPEYVAEAYSSSHRLRIAQLPFEIRPVEVALHALHRGSRTGAQQWLVDFIVELLRELVSDVQLPASRSAQGPRDRSRGP